MAYRSRPSRSPGMRPLVAFLLVASFGLLFVGCANPPRQEELVFTAEDMEQGKEMLRQEQQQTGTGMDVPYLAATDGTGASMGTDTVTLDLSLADTYKGIRSGGGMGADVYRVINEFLNVRSAPRVTADTVGRLDRGDLVTVLEFTDAQWAKVKMQATGGEGYVAQQYLGRLVSEEKLPEERKKFDGLYFVDFNFVNVRKEPNAQSAKIGELAGQALVKPLSIGGGWARIPFEGKEGFVSMEYVKPFQPNFLVRQEQYQLPILLAHATRQGSVESLLTQIGRLQMEGMNPITFQDFRDLLIEQERRDVRLPPKRFLVGVSGITPDNVKAVSEALTSKGLRATLFLETRYVGLSGITEKTLLTLMANGFDIQSAGHTGDDLRALTNAQMELELRQSRKILEDITKKEVFAILYPQGGVNDRVMELTADAGYLLGITEQPDRVFTREQFLRVPSIVVTPAMTGEELLKAVKG